MILHMDLGKNSYDILIKKGCLHEIKDHIDLQRNVLIVSDDGVPNIYIEAVQAQCPNAFVHIVKQGEGAKSLSVYQEISETLLEHKFSRKDLIIALGGGVVGDLAGFVASCYMRGIAFIQVPTTTLSQIDSSIGGKVAINLHEVKNIIGAFYQPKMVFVDPETLCTLSKRHYINGLVEALKAGLIYDQELFHLFEQEDIEANIETIITKALFVKKTVVEQDEKEQNLRKILNFGHTVGHAIETSYHLQEFYHGECVALGILPFIPDEDIRNRVRSIYQKLGLRDHVLANIDQWMDIMRNDKKADKDTIDTIWVPAIGHAEIKSMTFDEIRNLLENTL